jgi:hypothetical protein
MGGFLKTTGLETRADKELETLAQETTEYDDHVIAIQMLLIVRQLSLKYPC